MSGEITEEIQRFINDHIHSIEQLEILLLLADSAPLEWSAAEVSQKLYRQPGSVLTHLEKLRSQGFLSVRQAKPPAFRYRPNARYDTVIRGLERAYHVRRDAVIQCVFGRPPQ